MTSIPSGSPTTHQPGLVALCNTKRSVGTGRTASSPTRMASMIYAELTNSVVCSKANRRSTASSRLLPTDVACISLPSDNLIMNLYLFILFPRHAGRSALIVYDLIFYSGHPDSQPF